MSKETMKNKLTYRLLSLLLSVAMVMTMLPVTAWAEVSSQGETATYTVTVKEPNPDRKPWEIWKPEEIAVSGATVEVWGEGQEEAAASATTDEDGKAELSWAMDDSIPQWTCRISKLGYGEQELEIDPLSNETESTVILNQTAYLVVGESEDESEEVPLQGVTIKFIPKDGESGEPITIMTDEDGQFYIAGQLEEKVAYDLEITLSGYKPLTVESFDPAITEYKLQKLDGNEVYFNKEEFHATFGEEIEDYPELVFDPKESGTGRKIEYSIDLPGKVADIDRETGELTILHTGRATVTATVEANEQYERAKATYTLIVEKAKPELKFAFSENTFSDGDGTEKTPYVLTYGTDLRDGLKIEVTSTNSEEENFNYEVESFSAEENEDNSPYFDPKDPSLLRFGDGWTGKAHIQVSQEKTENYSEAKADCWIEVRYAEIDDSAYQMEPEVPNNWYNADITIKANPGYTLSTSGEYTKNDWEATLTFELEKFKEGNNKITFYVKNVDGKIGKISKSVNVDKSAPNVSIYVDEEGKDWLDSLFSFFRREVEKKPELIFDVKAEDGVSQLQSVEYYIEDGAENFYYIKDKESLKLNTDEIEENGQDKWQSVDGKIEIGQEQSFVLYVKATDNAGNVKYAATNGVIFEGVAPEIEIAPAIDPDESSGYYNAASCDEEGNIPLKVTVTDRHTNWEEGTASPDSGLKEVKYAIWDDTKENEPEDLNYTTLWPDNDNTDSGSPTYGKLTREITETIKVNTAEHNYDNVTVKVVAIDNAGNQSNAAYHTLHIDIASPKIRVEFDNTEPVRVEDEHEYYDSVRTATVTITERPYGFNEERAKDSIIEGISAVNISGNQVESACTIEKVEEHIDEENLDDSTYTFKVTFPGSANYDFCPTYTDNAGNANELVQPTPWTFTVDTDVPEGKVYVDTNEWGTLIETLTFGIFSDDKFEISFYGNDKTSPIEMAYHIEKSSTSALTLKELEKLEDKDWKEVENRFTIEGPQAFTVYLRVTDYAGHIHYVSSDGHILDNDDPTVSITAKTEPTSENGYYNQTIEKIELEVKAEDLIENWDSQKNGLAPSAGLKEVKYAIWNDTAENEPEDLNYTTLWPSDIDFTDSESYPTYEELPREITETIEVDTAEHNYDNVTVKVLAVDNAGNYSEAAYYTLHIDITSPEIQVEFDDTKPVREEDGRGYYDSARTATVTITERPSGFEVMKATESIVDGISASNISGHDDSGNLSEDTYNIGEWTENKDLLDPDNTTYTTTVTFHGSAKYDFQVSYTDNAGNVNNEPVEYTGITPQLFTVDIVEPYGAVSVEENIWKELIKTLTFGIWYQDPVTATAEAGDITSPIESVKYFKTSDTTAKSREELDAVTEWSPSPVVIGPNEHAVVYVKITDYADNVNYISTNGIIVDDNPPKAEKVAPEVTLTPEQPVNGLYRNDVKVDISVEDPTVNDTYSGLKEVSYVVTSLGEVTQSETLMQMTDDDPDYGKLDPNYDGTITVDKNINNSNDVTVTVYAEDNAGNRTERSIDLKIDVTRPDIDVSYSNNNGDTSFGSNTYFNANRTATIVITERNFDPKDVKVNIRNTDGAIPSISGWTTRKASGNGDGTTHTATVTYSADGDYTFDIEYTDEAGNRNTEVSYGNSLAPQKFTIDKTDPVVRVSYDNNQAANGDFYRNARTATITVTEHNFETSRMNISLRATNDGKESSIPSVSGWSSRGDVHTATIRFAEDGYYTFDLTYADMANNRAAEFAQQSFYIDQTAPEVRITGLSDHSANKDKGNIGFVLESTDINFDTFTPELTAVIRTENGYETVPVEGKITSINHGKRFVVENLEEDGVYTLTASITDKAGNGFKTVQLLDAEGTPYTADRTSDDALLTFSVNRNGSVFRPSDTTLEVTDRYYIKNVNGDIVIEEVNADPLKKHVVRLNGEILAEGTDYSVRETGGNGEWNQYTYTIFKSLFEAEGEYKIVIESIDGADSTAFSDIKNAEVSFVVDRTAPIVTVSGLESGGRYQEENHTVTMIPADDGGKLATLKLTVSDAEQNQVAEYQWSGEELETALQEGEGAVTAEIPSGLDMNVKIVCTDAAADTPEETGNTFEKAYEDITVSGQWYVIFYANKPLFYGCIAGVAVLVAALVVFLILWKKKSNRREEQS